MKLAVTMSVYKLEQDNSTLEMKFYACSVCKKTIQADRLYSMPELFDLMCDLCHENDKEESDGRR